MRDRADLEQRRHLPLNAKILMSQARIREWYNHWNGDVYVSFSGGKDSTVLAHLVRDLYPDVPLVFSNTGLEYLEIQSFARKMGAEFIRPEMPFSEVISKYGYPIISKENAEAIYVARKIRSCSKWTNQKCQELNGERLKTPLPEPQTEEKMWQNWRRKALMGEKEFSKEAKSIFNKEKWLPLARDTAFKISHMCCNIMKKKPMHVYQKKSKRYPYIGTLTEESRLREQAWLKHGCNAFDTKNPSSQPMSFWTEQDVLNYVLLNNIEIASVYGNIISVDDQGFEYEALPGMGCKLKCSGCDRTGCIFCGFAVHLEKGETRFQRLAKTHPRQYEYCMMGGQWVDNPDYDPSAPKMDGDWVNWNPKRIWVPSKDGLGMKYVFDCCNELYGKDFIRYE